MNITKKGTYYKDKITRFRKLRYKDNDDLLGKPSITIDEICSITGLSKGLVAKLEKQNLKDNEAPSCNASSIKAYHDNLGCSYEYLMGKNQNSNTQYLFFNQDPILGSLPDNFWNNLRLSLTDEWSNDPNYLDRERFVILRLLLNNPASFKNLLDAIFNSLFEIYKLKNTPLPDYMRDDSIAKHEYSLDQIFNRFLHENILPNLTLVYQEYEEMIQKYKEHEEDLLAEMGQDFFEFCKNYTDIDK